MRHRGIRVTSLIGRLRLRCYRTGQLSPSWPHVASIGFVVPCGLTVTEVAVLEIRKTDKGANAKLSPRRGSPQRAVLNLC
jgi:hypothetical protein